MTDTDSALTASVHRLEPDAWHAAQDSPEFRELRHRLRRFVFPMTALFLAWYFAYVVLATYAPEFMSIRVGGAVNIGLLLGLSQFATTFLITAIYIRYADQQLDPLASEVRALVDGSAS